jgi:hypothetical protein
MAETTSFSVKSFYGSTRSSSAASSLERRLLQAERFTASTTELGGRLIKANLVPKSYSEEVAAFACQKDAIRWRNENGQGKNLAVFALELDSDGRRSFFVAHPRHAWQIIRAKKKSKR